MSVALRSNFSHNVIQATKQATQPLRKFSKLPLPPVIDPLDVRDYKGNTKSRHYTREYSSINPSAKKTEEMGFQVHPHTKNYNQINGSHKVELTLNGTVDDDSENVISNIIMEMIHSVGKLKHNGDDMERVLAIRYVHEEFVQKFASRSFLLKVGNAFFKNNDNKERIISELKYLLIQEHYVIYHKNALSELKMALKKDETNALIEAEKTLRSFLGVFHQAELNAFPGALL